jgi:hypothetical protein
MTFEPAAGRAKIRRLVGVYDANGSIRGELAYWIGARLGRTHCSLCDITHGSVRERPAWRSCRDGLPVPFDTYHRNDQPEPVRIATRDRAPAVLAETGNGFVVLLSTADLTACGGLPDALVAAVILAAETNRLDWP